MVSRRCTTVEAPVQAGTIRGLPNVENEESVLVSQLVA
jgi:hypothetical protein